VLGLLIYGRQGLLVIIVVWHLLSLALVAGGADDIVLLNVRSEAAARRGRGLVRWVLRGEGLGGVRQEYIGCGGSLIR
jgi:hypothetical protein